MSKFFEAPPPRPEVEEPEERRRPDWLGPPGGVLPCAVSVSAVVARTEEIAIGLAGVLAYPTGFEAEIVVVARSSRRLAPFRDPFDEYGAADTEVGSIPEHLLRLGLEYSDGRRSMNTNFRWPDMDKESDGERQLSMVIEKCRSMVTEKCRPASSFSAAARAPEIDSISALRLVLA